MSPTLAKVRSCAERLAQEGYDVLIVARTASGLEQVAIRDGSGGG